jgi:tRNA-specific 2-thiouridylase
MRDKNKKIKVIVAMSGGVDSSVTAALLKKAGFSVAGIMGKFWTEKKKNSNNSEKKARQVAQKIGIPFYAVNFEKEFRKKVVDYFLNDYKQGNTPNPCIVCNKEIKFGLLLKEAKKMNADFLATGHYSRLQREILNLKLQTPNKYRIKLFKGKDKAKDQSYFLWQLSQSQLKNVLFPVGNYTKPEVRSLAKKFDLPVAETPESQEVCFVDGLTSDFLKKYLKTKPGKIVDIKGNLIGQHNGLWFYTIGQRRGLDISQGPWFVVKKDFKKNNLIVSKNEKDLLKKEFIAVNVNWILRQNLPINAKVKIRYKSNFAEAKILKHKKNSVKVIFKNPQKAITPGQSAVFYKGKELLGGGVIVDSK